MTHLQVFEKFKARFPEYVNKNARWYPNGKNSIRIRHLCGSVPVGSDLIFSCDNEGNWRFETVDFHIRDMVKGEKKHA